jgi:hypothetical protein
LVATNIFWIYKTLDYSVSANYREESLRSCQNNILILQEIVNELNISFTREDFFETALKKFPEKEVVDKENIVSIDDLGFRFEDNRIVEMIVY